MQDILELLLKATGFLALLVPSAGWLAQQIARRQLDRDLEKFKSKVAHELESHKGSVARENQVATERLRSNLMIAVQAQQVAFSKNYDKTFEVVAEGYKKLQETVKEFETIFHQIEANAKFVENHTEFDSRHDAFVEYLDIHELYLDHYVVDKMRSLVNKMFLYRVSKRALIHIKSDEIRNDLANIRDNLRQLIAANSNISAALNLIDSQLHPPQTNKNDLSNDEGKLA